MRTNRLASSLEALDAARRKVDRRQAVLERARHAPGKVAHAMRESGELAERIARLGAAAGKYEDHKAKVDVHNFIRRGAAIVPAVIIVIFLAVGMPFHFIIGFWVYVLFLWMRSKIWPERGYDPAPLSHAVGLLDANGSTASVNAAASIMGTAWRSVEEVAAEQKVAPLEYALKRAEAALRKAEVTYNEEYELSLLSPEEQTAYWTRKRYDLEVERSAAEEAHRYEVMMELQEAADKALETANDQQRILEEHSQTAKEQVELALRTEKIAKKTAAETRRLRGLVEDEQKKQSGIFRSS